MRKLLIALPLFAGVSWASTTYYSGAQTEPAYERLLQQLNGSSVLLFEATDYDAGFMQSTARTDVKLNDAEQPDVLFTLEHTISHSPVSMVPESARFGAAKIVTRLSIDKLEDEELKEKFTAFNTGEPFVLTTDVAMDGTTDSEFKINSFEHVDENNPDKTASFSEGVINVNSTNSGDIKGNGMLPNLMISDDGVFQGEATDTNMTFTMKKLNDGSGLDSLGMLYDYTFAINMGESRITNLLTNQVEALIQNTNITAEQNLSAASPYAKFSMGVESIDTDQIPVQSFNINSNLSGFSMDKFIENPSFFEELQSANDLNKEELMLKLVDIMRGTFPPDSKLALNGIAETVNGDIDARINAWFTGNGSADGYTGMVTTGDLAKAFAATVDISADKAALNGTPIAELLENPLAFLYLTITDETVSLNATLDQLDLVVNNQSIPLEMMAGEMLQLPLEALLEMYP